MLPASDDLPDLSPDEPVAEPKDDDVGETGEPDTRTPEDV